MILPKSIYEIVRDLPSKHLSRSNMYTKLRNICAGNMRTQHVRSEHVVERPQLALEFFAFWLGQLRSVATRRRARLDSCKLYRLRCRQSSIVLPSRVCASVRVCLPVFVWKSVYAECENKPQAVKNGREKQQHQANHLYRVTTTTTTIILRKCAKNPQQKSNQQLKCWICLLFWLIAISHRSRREAARS